MDLEVRSEGLRPDEKNVEHKKEGLDFAITGNVLWAILVHA